MNTELDDILNKAVEVYNLETSLTNKDALRAALRAAVSDYESVVMQRISRAAFAFSDKLEGDVEASEGVTDACTALDAFAQELQIESKLLKERYVPADNDLVEVCIAGPVTIYEAPCSKCGHHDEYQWSVTDLKSGQEFFFEFAKTPNMTIRPIARDTLPDDVV